MRLRLSTSGRLENSQELDGSKGLVIARKLRDHGIVSRNLGNTKPRAAISHLFGRRLFSNEDAYIGFAINNLATYTDNYSSDFELHYLTLLGHLMFPELSDLFGLRSFE